MEVESADENNFLLNMLKTHGGEYITRKAEIETEEEEVNC